ncbi:hypothetical protein SAMN02745121_00119 [Nannocystis exedens]|uniref:Uncharacterized protein n=1 Tax=Nannocystis exedens TaxID=54 RepID=A0A1I1SRI6_9BACT|nr:hypothetical protein NAEX_08690 [Nannocystis exedens]SFD47358.1 hypothetical protein SAMN02745121_00119 [Nannocystis exedens]
MAASRGRARFVGPLSQGFARGSSLMPSPARCSSPTRSQGRPRCGVLADDLARPWASHRRFRGPGCAVVPGRCRAELHVRPSSPPGRVAAVRADFGRVTPLRTPSVRPASPPGRVAAVRADFGPVDLAGRPRHTAAHALGSSLVAARPSRAVRADFGRVDLAGRPRHTAARAPGSSRTFVTPRRCARLVRVRRRPTRRPPSRSGTCLARDPHIPAPRSRPPATSGGRQIPRARLCDSCRRQIPPAPLCGTLRSS